MTASSPARLQMLLLLLLVAAELGNATYYPGRQHLTCWSRRSRCFLRTIRCPASARWPNQQIPRPNLATWIAIHQNVKLYPNAKYKPLLITDRKADCHGTGAACYDPRFVGGDGVVFFFHGKANEHFRHVSDTNFLINARFIGLRPQGRRRDFTWIQALGFMYGPHTFTLGAKKVDGLPVFLSEGHLSEWSSTDHDLKLERAALTNSIIAKLPDIAEVSVNVVPVTEEDDQIHKYRIPSNDCFAHLEVQFRFYGLSQQVELWKVSLGVYETIGVDSTSLQKTCQACGSLPANE
ncbi:hypothetical protein EJ110_NYTH37860 [Nymphaea thermarum]|nr:hypothetical protein EJ110_NYTH37860 [Nymphaea thermarum]